MNRTNNFIRVFVTHKSEDIQKVNKFLEIMKIYDGAGRLRFVVVEDMPKGRDWRQFIHEQVVEANVLFFLMISSAVRWEWCVYEAGLFAGSKTQESNSNIIVFFNPSQHSLPSPLENLQAVKTDQDDVERFLRQFYGTTELTGIEPPLNCHFAENLSVIHDVAQDICAVLASNNQSS